MKLSNQIPALLLSSVVSCHSILPHAPLHFQSNIPGVQDDPDIYAEMVELMKEHTIDGGPVGYLGVFQGDLQFDDGAPSLVTQMKNMDIEFPDNLMIESQNLTAFASNPGVTCSPTKCLDNRPDDTKLSGDVDRQKVDSTGCEVLGRFVPAASGALFAILGGFLCAAVGASTPCAVLFGALGGVLGDFAKDQFVAFCKKNVATDNGKCKVDGIQQGCKDKRGRKLTLMRDYKPNGYTCKQATAGKSGAKCAKQGK